MFIIIFILFLKKQFFKYKSNNFIISKLKFKQTGQFYQYVYLTGFKNFLVFQIAWINLKEDNNKLNDKYTN